MPLFRKYEPTENSPTTMNIWRYWCSCHDPTHCLELIQEGDQIEMGVHVQPPTGIRARIIAAWHILIGKGHRYTEIHLDNEDRKEFAAIINGDYTC